MVNLNQIKIPKRKNPRFNSINEFTIIKEIGDGAFSTVYGHKVVSHDNIMTCGMTNLG